jgi:SAM-dependent methyltransferase
MDSSASSSDPYDALAPFYDLVNGEPIDRVRQLLSVLDEAAPDATTVLELGCGTGAVLAGLGSGYGLIGVDRSASMADVARRRLPTATIVIDDLATVRLGTKVDVVLCVLDTMNHLTALEQWRAAFATAADHLTAGGLFLFDVNTSERVVSLDESSPWVVDVDDGILVSGVTVEGSRARWHHRLFVATGGEEYRLVTSTIEELLVVDDVIRELLADDFDVIDVVDVWGDEEPARQLYVTRRR